MVLTNSSGTVVWSAVHEAFGEAHVDASSTVENNLRFPGQYFDAETGLHYNFHRYYDPATGRYTQTDPIGFAAGDSNLYRYVGGNAVNGIDPRGLFGEEFMMATADIHINPLKGSLSDNMGDAITSEEFVDWANEKPLKDLILEENVVEGKYPLVASLTAMGPNAEKRYVVDPGNPNQVIDMRHFLVVGRLGELVGFVGELRQWGNQWYVNVTMQTTIRDGSAFQRQDFYSNALGAQFFKNYYDPKGDLSEQLRKFFEDRKKNSNHPTVGRGCIN
jgi:RHS repeat-associated protein